MKTNVTLRVDSDLAREAKVLAAQRGTSLSQLMAEQLKRLLQLDRDYQAAQSRALARLEEGYELDWERPTSRDELHER